MQPEFAEELLRLCKGEGLHTALDTSGYRLDAAVERVLDWTDLVLLDLKMTSDEQYRKFTGCAMEKPLHFLNRLEERGIDCWIRQVIVPGVNDTAENIRRLNDIMAGKRCIRKVELLPFHKICDEGLLQMPEFDALLDQAVGESSVSRAAALYLQAEQMLIDRSIFLPFYCQTEYFVSAPGVSGVSYRFDIRMPDFRFAVIR